MEYEKLTYVHKESGDPVFAEQLKHTTFDAVRTLCEKLVPAILTVSLTDEYADTCREDGPYRHIQMYSVETGLVNVRHGEMLIVDLDYKCHVLSKEEFDKIYEHRLPY